MRWVLLSLLFMCAGRAEGAAKSYTFGGFSPGGREYWKRGPDDLVCEPAPSTACRAVEKKETRRFVKPPRGRRAGGLTLSVAVQGEARMSLMAGDREVGDVAFEAGHRVTSVNSNLFVSPDEALVAVEYELTGEDGKRADVVVFDLRSRPAPAEAARPPVPAAGNAYDRALGKGGVWEQRIVPCDLAGVTLKLAKTRKFGIRITTKCQGQKDVTDLDGTWATEGDDTLVLAFPNEEGAIENMVCRFSACADVAEDCLTCTQEDVTFTMQVVRR